MQGDAFGAARWLAAGAFLILPLLWAVVSDQDPWSLGPMGDALWLAFLLGIAGLPMLLAGYVALSRLLRRTVQAIDQGHQWRVVALVAADLRRDTGFLLQGARLYQGLTPRMRRSLANARLLVAALAVFAAAWLSLGFGLSVVLAARGILDPAGVVFLTLAPAVLVAAAATLTYAWEEGVLRRTRKRWHRQPWTDDMVREEVTDWNAAMAVRAPAMARLAARRGEGADSGRGRLGFRTANVVVGALTFVAFVPVFALVFSAAILPLLARVTVPELEGMGARYAALEPLRRYAVDPDPAITPVEAGATLHALSFVGRPYRASEGVLPPVRSYDAPWFPPVEGRPVDAREWARAAIDGMGERLDAETVAYLERVAAHPAHAEIARLARAPGLDVAAARWSMPLPSDLTMAELAIPPMGPVRAGAYAHLSRAALLAHRGEVAAAESDIREVISAGLLLADHGPTILDNLVGLVTADLGGEALESLYRRTGHPGLGELAWSREAASASIRRTRAGRSRDIESRLRAMPAGVVDEDLLRGMRWEYVNLLNTLGPCMNLRRAVFGPAPGHEAWVQEARSGLVRSPAEAELFEVARSGLLGARLDEPPGLSTRLLALTMGGADRPGSCARVFGELVDF